MWTLDIVITHFDWFFKKTDFASLRSKTEEEYRLFLLQTANDSMFCEGRYSNVTEATLELFDEPEVIRLTHDLSALNALKPKERERLKFYLDLKEVCYPLFRGQVIDWSAYPWNMKDPSYSMQKNKELWDFVNDSELRYLAAAVLYDCFQRMWHQQDIYTSVMLNDLSNSYYCNIDHHWKQAFAKKDEDKEKLVVGMREFADDLWATENHLEVAHRLGLDLAGLSVYDAMDGYMSGTFRYNQVDFAREMSEWLHTHWTMGEEYPPKEQVKLLFDTLNEKMEQYDVICADKTFMWNLITLDLLGMSVVPKRESKADEHFDDEDFDDEDFDDDDFDDEDFDDEDFDDESIEDEGKDRNTEEIDS